jgi:DNA polymerase
MVRVFLDLETYNEEPITNGTHKYAETAEILLLAYAIDDGEAKVWDRTAVKPMPEELKLVLRRDDVIFIAHNSSFDRTVLKRFSKRFEDVNNWEDTMVRALAHSLPGALGTLCALYQVEEDKAKDRDGKKLIQYFCKPRPEGNKLKRFTRFTHPNEWERFKDYCRLDVEAMRDIYKRMPTVNNTAKELALWRLDQKINDRGFAVDVELVESAIKAVTEEQARTRKRTKVLTEGELESTTKRDEFLRHLLWVHGVDLPDAQAATIERRIEDPQLPEGVKELLRLRLRATTSSTAKYKKLRSAVSSDGRLRGSLQFCGAGRTARWSGRMFQPQNLPRPTLHSDEIELGIEALKAGCADMVFGDQVMELASSALRGCIIAPPGNKLVVADLSNIEGRDQAWIAGEKWKLKAFSEYDAGTGHDLYALAYAKMFKVTPESVIEDKKKGGNQRQIGKTSELSGGYGGGVGSFVTFATAFGLDLDALAEQAEPFIDARIRAEAEGMWDWAVKKKRTLDLEKHTFIVMDSFKRQWREAHPNITSYWPEIEDKTRMAIANPKHEYNARGIVVERRGPWLYLRLPSGRSLSYPNASVAEDGSISFMGINQYTRKWSRIKTYGGKLFENLCQAVARDVMAENMAAIRDAGYDIVLSVHDELICEAPDRSEFNPEHLSSLLAKNPPWALDMPLAAAGFEAYRYKKE